MKQLLSYSGIGMIILLIVLASTGCSYIMPPQKIPMDRGNYLNAVSTSWKEQLLSNLVRLRYGDTLTSLEMTSVTTAYELDAGLAASYPVTWHPLRGTTGFRNVVGVGGSASYQDKPTITYVPMRGDALSKTMIEPINLSKILKSLQTGWAANYIFSCCVKSINHLRNRSSSGDIPAHKYFSEFIWLFSDLKTNGVIRITIEEPVEPKVTKIPTKYDVTLYKTWQGKKEKIEPGEESAMKDGKKPKEGMKTGEATDNKREGKEDSAIVKLELDENHAEYLDNLAKEQIKRLPEEGFKAQMKIEQGKERLEEDKKTFKAKMKRFKELLWPKVSSQGKQDFGKVYKIIDGNQHPLQSDPDCDKIVMQTRSILEILHMLSMFIEVPLEHVTENRAKESPLLIKGKEPLYGNIMFIIYSSKERPRDAFVAVKYGDYWFYLKDTDIDSKDVFSSTEGILSMSESGTTAGTPVLTLPVQ
jgi:hypothetical protein